MDKTIYILSGILILFGSFITAIYDRSYHFYCLFLNYSTVSDQT